MTSCKQLYFTKKNQHLQNKSWIAWSRKYKKEKGSLPANSHKAFKKAYKLAFLVKCTLDNFKNILPIKLRKTKHKSRYNRK